MRDVEWLGYHWANLCYASDYFEQLYQFAEDLITQGKAYIDSQTGDEIRETRGTLTEPGTNSPWRDRPADDSLDLFRRMRAGEFEDGVHVLRAKIDMASPQHATCGTPCCIGSDTPHHWIARVTTGASTRCTTIRTLHLEDAIEDITHSLCTLEFEEQPRTIRLGARQR